MTLLSEHLKTDVFHVLFDNVMSTSFVARNHNKHFELCIHTNRNTIYEQIKLAKRDFRKHYLG